MGKAKELVWQAPVRLTFSFGPNATVLTGPDVAAIIADADYELQSVAAIWETAGDDGGTVTLDVTKCTGTQAAASGTSMLTSAFNLKSTINTVVRKDVQRGTLAVKTTRTIRKDNRICFNFAGTTATLTGLNITLVLKPLSRPVW